MLLLSTSSMPQERAKLCEDTQDAHLGAGRRSRNHSASGRDDLWMRLPACRESPTMLKCLGGSAASAARLCRDPAAKMRAVDTSGIELRLF